MKLLQKIKHIKRHKANKKFAKLVDNLHFAAAECFLNGNENVFIVSSRLYNIMNCRKGCVPKNIQSFDFSCDTDIIKIPRDIVDFMNTDQLDYMKEWCGIPTISSEPLYCHIIDKAIAPDICTLNGVRV
jgi:hypothetical protein